MIDRLFFLVTALLAAIFLTMLINTVRADQQRTIYGSDGRVIGRETTDSQGTRTLYGSHGNAIIRQSPTTGGTVIYDAKSGNAIGKTSKDKR